MCMHLYITRKTFFHTSLILTGVPTRLGMHGRGQCSRHSGCETTLQSRHFSEILPNFILFPQGTHDSGLMTYNKTLGWTLVKMVFNSYILHSPMTRQDYATAMLSEKNSILTVLETNSCKRTPPCLCGVLGCIFISPSGMPGCLKISRDWTDSESNSMAAEYS